MVEGNRLSKTSQRNITELRDVTRRGNRLDPMWVWKDPDNGSVLLVNGHHRYYAVARMKKGPKPETVWVQYLKVETEEEARQLAMRENLRSRVPMSRAEARHAVWLMILEGNVGMSQRAIEREFGITGKTLRKMIKLAPQVRRSLEQQAEFQEIDYAFISAHAPLWKDVSAFDFGNDDDDGDLDEEQRRIEQQIKDALVATFGDSEVKRTQPFRNAFDWYLKSVLEGQPEEEPEED
ncbi:hypothetical protein [Ralstonia pseudosolanacearum]